MFVLTGQLYFGDYHTSATVAEKNTISHGGLGGHGGGALKLKTRHAVVDGVISVNGQNAAPQSNSGGGSGGSINFICDDLSGFGFFQANGAADREKGVVLVEGVSLFTTPSFINLMGALLLKEGAQQPRSEVQGLFIWSREINQGL